MRPRLSSSDYIKGILSGDRIMLGKAITLIESNLDLDQKLAQDVLNSLPLTGKPSFRIGITGPPGAGKSTFIEAFGQVVLKHNKSLAVLAIDPSSSKTKGSILGDKTRMGSLASHKDAFIRPTSSGSMLGGVAMHTREAMQVCEAAGFDVIIIETVGVGQSEIAVSEMVDFFLLLLSPAGGDELQGMKKGIVELADLIVINKADGEYLAAAKKARSDYANALHLFRNNKPGWTPDAVTCSALNNNGIDKIWNKTEDYFTMVNKSGFFQENRKSQNNKWLHDIIRNRLTQGFYQNKTIQAELATMEELLRQGKTSPILAANHVFSVYGKNAG